ncbi:hypothetical protein Pint_22149 [Pistacia integerrima]|uniref:Uncharacterized protein n=1 Tax=Pistacia integerrima TaxID=434235 RepID=A0ACC0YJE6_9ROSI|nr:hypothetical protein Pint_22149 [Pistacia integerrima]
MRREGSLLPFSNFLVSVLIFLFITEIQARKLQQKCPSCGEINNIKCPCRLKGDPAKCGHPNFKLSCQSDKTILEFRSGKYYVKGISHKENTISVVDVNLASGACRLPYGSLSDIHKQFSYDVKFRLEIDSNYSYATIFWCPQKINDPLLTRIPCLSENQFYSYVTVYYPEYQYKVCSLNAVTPIYWPYELFGNKTDHYETISKSLQSGSILHGPLSAWLSSPWWYVLGRGRDNSMWT